MIHPDNVDNVMKELQFRSGRLVQLVKDQVEIVRDMPQVKAYKLVCFLKIANAKVHLANLTFIDDLVSKQLSGNCFIRPNISESEAFLQIESSLTTS